MSTKSKPAKTKGTAGSLESRLCEAIEMVSADKTTEAIPLFEAIANEAAEAGNFSLARAARGYIVHEQQKSIVPADADPIQEAVYLLNTRQPEAALEKINEILKSESSVAHVHYLKALALANTQQAEQSAEFLKKAIDLDPALLHVYRLEPEFKPYRNSPDFADFETA
jgi:tetratricopeptide (TPR) repeat protein